MRIVVPMLLMLAACQDERPQAPTAAEAEQLNEGEAMLDEVAVTEGR